MSRNPPGCLAEHVCVCVSVRACVLAVRVMSEGEKQGDPPPGVLMHYQPAAPQQASTNHIPGCRAFIPPGAGSAL